MVDLFGRRETGMVVLVGVRLVCESNIDARGVRGDGFREHRSNEVPVSVELTERNQKLVLDCLIYIWYLVL